MTRPVKSKSKRRVSVRFALGDRREPGRWLRKFTMPSGEWFVVRFDDGREFSVHSTMLDHLPVGQ